MSAIISLYGLIEQTIDAILVGAAAAHSTMYAKLEDLPDHVRSEYRSLLLRYLQDEERVRFRGSYSENAGVAALSAAPGAPVDLLSSVFTLKTANYRAAYVRSLFERLLINVEGGLNVGLPSSSLDATGFASYASFLDDLVERRNEIAHSYGDSNLLGEALLSHYAEIVFTYLDRVERVVNRAILKVTLERTTAPIGVVVKTWTGRIGIELDSQALQVGDTIVLLKDDWCTSHAIQSLMSEGVEADSFSVTGASLNVAAGVESAPTHAENAVVYLLSDHIREYWPLDSK